MHSNYKTTHFAKTDTLLKHQEKAPSSHFCDKRTVCPTKPSEKKCSKIDSGMTACSIQTHSPKDVQQMHRQKQMDYYTNPEQQEFDMVRQKIQHYIGYGKGNMLRI